MNYIKALQAENTMLKAQLAAGAAAIRDFRGHLYSPKFSGVESDGSRKDWISTGDVLGYLTGIDSALTAEPVCSHTYHFGRCPAPGCDYSPLALKHTCHFPGYQTGTCPACKR